MNFFEPKDILNAAIQEDVDVVGISSSVEGHLPVAREVTESLRQSGKQDVLVVFGGVIPERDVEKMKEMGVKGIFGPGSSAESIVTFLRENVRQPRVDFD